MRVLHLGKFFPPYVGGIERFTALLLHALAAPHREAMRRDAPDRVAPELTQAALVHATPGHPRQPREWTDPLSGAQLREVPGAQEVRDIAHRVTGDPAGYRPQDTLRR